MADTDRVVKVRSEYSGHEHGYPVTLYAEIAGSADSFETAQQELTDTFSMVLPTLSMATYAAIEGALPVTAHALDLPEPGNFVSQATPGLDEWFPPGLRKVPLPATYALLEGIGSLLARDAFMRACESFRQALLHWKPETGLMAGELLYVAAEALAQFHVENRAQQRGITEKNLARLEGCQTPKELKSRYLREDVLGDKGLGERMAEASNGFGHGFMGFDTARGHFESVLDEAFPVVRQALVVASGISQEHRDTLLAPPYDTAQLISPVVRVLLATIAAKEGADRNVELDGLAVDLAWEPVKIEGTRQQSDGTLTLEFAPERCNIVRMDDRVHLSQVSLGKRVPDIGGQLRMGETEWRPAGDP